jgi:hypothetical protein
MNGIRRKTHPGVLFDDVVDLIERDFAHEDQLPDLLDLTASGWGVWTQNARARAGQP